MLRALLLSLSANRRLQALLERNAVARAAARRFIAGSRLEDGLAVVTELNRQGWLASLDELGENTQSPQQAELATADACASLQALQAAGLRSGISVKLTQIGLGLDGALAAENLRRIASTAAACGRFVRVDMEQSAFTEPTLALVERLHGEGWPLGTVLQAALRRSAADTERLIAHGVPVRLVKGAYREPDEVAFQRKRDVDASFLQLVEMLLVAARESPSLHPAIATHDPGMIQATLRLVERLSLPREVLEFQMLYGIRRDLQRQLRQQGWRVRVYVPFGAAWYPYFMRRLAERPANLWFLLKNLVD